MAIGLEKTKILVVDDLPDRRLTYQTVLEELEQDIVLAGSGLEALKQVLLHDFAVILLDVNMPDMDGFETARLIRGRKRSSTTPIIFLTAFADEMRTAEGYASGAVDYLATPVHPEILRAKVRVFIELYQMRREVERRAEEKARQAAMEEANRQLTFLSKAGAVLGRSLDLAATARDIVRLPVPLLADRCLLSLENVRAAPWKGLSVELNAEGSSELTELAPTDPFPVACVEAIQRVADTGQTEYLGGAPREKNQDPHTLVMPLQAQNRTMAVLCLSRAASGGTFNPDEVTVASAFAWRAATALDNAMLHEEIRRADQQKNEFLSMLAHELRNPLAPIRNAVQLLGPSTDGDSEARWVREVIERQVTQMVRLVDDLLDVSRLTSGKIRLRQQTVELTTVIEHALEASRPLIDAHRQRLAVTLPAEPVWVQVDLARLAQVFTNLLNNAAKYTEKEGQIWLSARLERDTVCVSVKDTGIGIPSHMLEDVFDLFTQVDRTLDRSQGGLGIGLTLVRRLVAMHGGSVEARSAGVGCGSEFLVRLPVARLPQAAERELGHDCGLGGPATKVLVIDDNVDSADTLASLLRLGGHQVDVAYDGPTGLEATRILQPEILLLDIGLPGMDGYEVAEQVRQLPGGKSLLIVAVSGYNQARDQRRSKEAGIDHFLVKPVNFRELQSLLIAAPRLESVAAK